MEPRTGRTWTTLVVAAAAVGLGVALYLTKLHLDLLYGSGVGTSLCDFSEGINCSAVNASPASEIFGIPQSVLAIPAYVIALALGVSASVRRDERYALALAGVGLLAVLYSARLAWISATVVGAWCLFCMALYLVNIALFVLGVVGSGASLRSLPKALALLPVRAPLVIVSTLCVGLLVLGGAYGAYSEVRGVMVADAAAKAVAPPAPTTAKAETADLGTKPLKLPAATIEVVPPADAPTWGPASARVSIVEWSDFQCPFCKRLSGSLRQLVQERPNDVRLAYVQDPLNLDCSHAKLQKTMHPEACAAASAGVCAAEQEKFWPMHDALFDRQGELGRKTYLEIADELGLDRAAFEQCLDDPATHEKLLSDTDLGVRFGVTGTPTFFVNGRKMAGAQPIEVLRAVVDQELAGNKAALDLEVAIGTEETGTVTAKTDVVPIAALGKGQAIDAFEDSIDGGKAVSRAGVEPARNVSWFEARDACAASGRRLCTEREWLAACTGTAPADEDRNGILSDDPILGRKYGYGEDRHSGACADSRMPDDKRELLTGNHPKCSTPDGIYDLVGGVKEWVGLTPATAATKGGSYSSAESARCGYYREDMAPETKEAATGFRCCSGPPDPEPPPIKPGHDVGETVASFEVPLLDGGALQSKKLSGRPTVVTFWASWCGPCQKEMPALAKLYEGYRDEGLDVVAISVDTDETKLRVWLDQHPMPFRIARDPGGKLMDTFSTRGLPTTLWIKKDGTIRLRTTGLPPGADKRLNELAAELVGVEPKPEVVADAKPAPKQ